MPRNTFNLFLMGLAFGWGPCLASCGPVLIPYIAGTRKNSLKGVGAYLLFSCARIAVYLVLGVAVFFLGKFIIEAWLVRFSKYIYVILGALLVIIGGRTAGGRNLTGNRLKETCRFLIDDEKSIIVMGLIMGLLPCVPLLALLGYSGLVSKTWIEALIYSFSFALGTVLSPLLILSALTGLIPNFLAGQKQIYYKILSFIRGLIIMFLGIQLIRQAYA